MKLSKRWALLALPLALAACNGEEPAEEDPGAVVVTPGTEPATVPPAPAATPADTGMAAMGGMGTVPLSPVGNSGVSGEANLTAQGQQTQVAVQLRGMQPNSVHAGHVHHGTCDSLGAPAAPLPDVTAGADEAGSATGTVPLEMNTVMNGQHVIAYHERGGQNPGAPIVCGSIPAHQM